MANTSGMDEFCGSTFWNTSLTWETTEPDFTICFERTVLVWAPCLFLWVFSTFETYYLLNSKTRDVPRSWLFLSKMIDTCILFGLAICDLGYAISQNSKGEDVYAVDYYTPLIQAVTFLLAAVLLECNRRRGMRTSGVLFIFWFFLAVCGAVQYRTIVNKAIYEDEKEPFFLFVTYMIYYPVVVFMFFMNCFADKAPRFSEYPHVENIVPEKSSSFLSRITYTWFDTLAWQGFRKPLENSDLWNMNPEDTSAYVVPIFEKYWNQSLRKSQKVSGPKATFSNNSASVEITAPTTGKGKQKYQASILPALIKAFGPTFLFGSFMKFINDLLTFVNPQLLRLLIGFVSNDEEMWKGYLYSAALFINASFTTLVLAQYFHRMFIVGLRVRTAVISTIYRKALRLSNASRKESTVGEIVNLMAVDAQRFMDLTTYLNMIWSAPLQIALALYFLWQILGPSVLAGLAVMIILIPVNGVIATRIRTLQIRQMKNKDQRVKLMNEVLSGIKVLKLYAWEPSFEEQILKIREKEIKVLKQAAYLNAGTSFIWSCAPFLVSLVTFATFVLSSEDNILDSETAFVSLSLFNILRFPLSMLPMLITSMVQASVSVKRLNKFMNMEELDPTNVMHDPAEADPLVIENGTFSWGADESPVLKGINLRCRQGSLVAVVGTVGSGKSSLISAFIGEMEKITGRVNTKGSLAYVPQQAWIQNATLQDNVTFSRPLNHLSYNRIIEACALNQDIDMLPGGDKTEIGEKGINLSGGQKQRVSLARAVYCDADVYFLDDPLSAVDSHVGKHIFDNVIGPHGLLKKKTRILVTHGITYLPDVDHIIVLKEGEITETGTYKQLLDKKGAFAEFLLQHLQEVAEGEDASELEEIKLQLESTLGAEEFQRQISRQKSRISESDSTSLTGSLGRKNSDSVERSVKRSPSTEKEGSNSAQLPAKPTGQKLIEVEKSETGSVKWNVYLHYLVSIGLALTVATLILNVIYQGFSIGTNVWLSVWSNAQTNYPNSSLPDTNMYLGVYGALGLGQAALFSLGFIVAYMGCLGAAQVMHDTMINNICKCPMSFFDVTPKGRILQRCSKDVEMLDYTLIIDIQEVVPTILEMCDVCGIFVGVASIFGDFIPRYGCWTAAVIMHRHMLLGVLRAPLSFFDTTPTGRIMSRFSKDMDVLDISMPMYISDCTWCFFEVLATLVVISVSTPIFVTVIIPIGIIYFFVQRFYVATSRQLKRIESISRSPIYSHFGESVTGTSTIRAYYAQDRFIKESEDKVDYNQIAYYPSIIANRWLAVRLEMVGNLIILFAALFSVLGRDNLNPGLVGLSVSYALQITQTLNWLVRMTSDVETNIVAVERIKEYGETKQEAAWDIPSTQPKAEWPEVGKVEFKNYQVRYREGLDLVLHGISCSVNGGEKVGIVGRTGAGKSSLTLGLFRIIEAAGGSILIDDIDISTLGLHALRSRLTIIPQDPVLFSGTLRLNLDPFEQNSDEQVWRALEHAHLKYFVKGLPAGLMHEIAEGGENLSVGQRQLVCLARALLRKTKVLILDEATAAVDLETDDLIQQTIRSEFKDCTVLTIAHRLNTILDSDRVIVLDKGKIVEFDNPDTLLQQKKSVFYSMAKDANLIA